MPSRTSSNASTGSSRSKSTASSRSASTTTTQTTNTTTSSNTVNPGLAPHAGQALMLHANQTHVNHGNNIANNAWSFDLPADDSLAHIDSWTTPDKGQYLDGAAARSQQILQLPYHVHNGRQTASWGHLVAIDPMAAELESILTTGRY
nr:hypothetical protein B0A51_15787 [Rachicladosporium sp. CCFEE 5018]